MPPAPLLGHIIPAIIDRYSSWHINTALLEIMYRDCGRWRVKLSITYCRLLGHNNYYVWGNLVILWLKEGNFSSRLCYAAQDRHSTGCSRHTSLHLLATFLGRSSLLGRDCGLSLMIDGTVFGAPFHSLCWPNINYVRYLCK